MEYNYKEKEKIETKEEGLELLKYLAKYNDPKFSLTKAAEELNELSLVLLQYVNKKGNYRPSRDSIIEELGDANMMIYLVTEVLDISEEEIQKRISYKANKKLSYLKSEQYVKGV